MLFEWDDPKAASNRVKHGVSFELAREVWGDPLHVILPDRIEAGEQRWHAIGLVGAMVILVVVHTYAVSGSDEIVRIVGARKATAHEKKRYEQDGA